MKPLITYFKKINKDCFNNKLPICEIVFSEDLPGYACLDARKDPIYKYTNPTIWIKKFKGKLQFSEEDIIRLLIHEMVHYEVLVDYAKGKIGRPRNRRGRRVHSKAFFKRANQMEFKYWMKNGHVLSKLSVDVINKYRNKKIS